MLSCLPGNTSKLSQRLRISCIDGRCAVTPVVVRSSCLRVNDWFSLLLSPLFCFRDKKGEKEDHFPTRGESSATFCHTENKLLLWDCLHSLKLHFFFAWFQKHMWTSLSESCRSFFTHFSNNLGDYWRRETKICFPWKRNCKNLEWESRLCPPQIKWQQPHFTHCASRH